MLQLNFKLIFLIEFLLIIVNCDDSVTFDSQSSSSQTDLFTITGRINKGIDEIDLVNTFVSIDDGQYIGHVKADGSFTISNIPSNSYAVEVISPKSYFEPVRVDITSKGKIRSRRLNLLQPNEVKTLKYPLNFESKGLPNYFQKREQFRILDILMSPMVLMMVVPLLLVVVLPKLVNQDPELQRELQQSPMLQPTQNMPDVNEIFYNLLGNKKAKPTPTTYNTKQQLSNTGSLMQQRKANN